MEIKRGKGEAYYTRQALAVGLRHYSSGRYVGRNRALVSLLQPYRPRYVFEFAGAEADLAEKILTFIPSVEHYLWSDFCHTYVEHARKRLKWFPKCRVERIDVNRDFDRIPYKRFDMVVSTASEHIENDLEIIKRVEPGTVICLSVPSCDAGGHVRYFWSLDDVKARFRPYMSFEKTLMYPIPIKKRRDRFLIAVKLVLVAIDILGFRVLELIRRLNILKKPTLSCFFIVIGRRKP